MGLFDSQSRTAIREQNDLYRERADRLASDARTLLSGSRIEDAEERVRQLIDLQGRVVGDRHPDYASGLALLAEILLAKEELSDAETLLQRVLGIRKKALGEKHPDYAETLDRLGRLTLRWEDLVGAEPLLRKALEIRKLTVGEKHPDYASSLVALAELQSQQEELGQAEAMLHEALAIQKKALGETHPDYAQSALVLADVLARQERYDEAEPLLLHAVEVLKSSFGDPHPRHISAISALADLYQRKGLPQEAEPLWRLLLDMRKQSQSGPDTESALIETQIAQILQRRGELAEAEVLFRKAASTLKQTLGDRHPDYAASLTNLAQLLQRSGDLQNAESLFRQVVAIRKDVLGLRHPDYSTSLINLALLVQKRGDPTWAKMLLRDAVDLRRAVSGEHHPDYAHALSALADVLTQQGETQKAEPLLLEALEIRQRAFGRDHASVANTLSSLASLHRKQKDNETAEQLLREALAIREKVLGTLHTDVATNLGNLAWLLQNRGDLPGAERLLGQAMEIRRQLLGEQHPEVKQNLERLQAIRADARHPGPSVPKLISDVSPLEAKIANDPEPAKPFTPEPIELEETDVDLGTHFDPDGERIETSAALEPELAAEIYDEDDALREHVETLFHDLAAQSEIRFDSVDAIEVPNPEFSSEDGPVEEYENAEESVEPQMRHEETSSCPSSPVDDSRITPEDAVPGTLMDREPRIDRSSRVARSKSSTARKSRRNKGRGVPSEVGSAPVELPEPTEPEPATVSPEVMESARSMPVAEFTSPGAPGFAEAMPVRSPLMSQNSSDLSQELAALSDRFSDIGERLLAAARQFHAPGAPPSEELIDAIGVSRRDFFSLRDRTLELAGSLHLSCPPADQLGNLQAINAILDAAAEAEIRKSRGEETRRRAVSLLDRVKSIAHTSIAPFEPLAQVHEQAHSLHAGISESAWAEMHPDAEKLAAGDHHFADLLALIENHDELSDEQWATLHESVSQNFGKALAAAAARSKLVVHASASDDHAGNGHAGNLAYAGHANIR